MSTTAKLDKPKLIELNVKEFKKFYSHIISNNRYLQSKGKIPVAVELQGDSGIGKTSGVLQIGEEMELQVVKLNLAQIEEIGDLVGFPIRQFEMIGKTDAGVITSWVDENALDQYVKTGYMFTGQNRMGYCPPAWISNIKKGLILLIDDWTRADTRFIQAVMELIDRQTYISWKLPEDSHIILTSNPDNGEYNVNTIDPAQRTRFITMKIKFDKDCWAEWAEDNDIDGRCINFLIMHPELVNKNVNARSIVMFFNSISSIENFEESLPLIHQIAEGCVGEEFASLFSMFINNRMDKIVSPEFLMEGANLSEVKTKLVECLGEGMTFRGDVAGTLATRLVNYSIFKAKPESGKTEISRNYIQRLESIIMTKAFGVDISYAIVKQIYHAHPKFKQMLYHKEFSAYITK